MAFLYLTQGATRTVTISGIVDAAGVALDVTGWAVVAQVRASASPSSPLLAEWVSGSPTGTQGQATAAGSVVKLEVPHTMSSAWTWRRGALHCEITEPTGAQRRERIADEVLVIEPEIVR